MSAVKDQEICIHNFRSPLLVFESYSVGFITQTYKLNSFLLEVVRKQFSRFPRQNDEVIC